jgi:hypothetical protein
VNHTALSMMGPVSSRCDADASSWFVIPFLLPGWAQMLGPCVLWTTPHCDKRLHTCSTVLSVPEFLSRQDRVVAELGMCDASSMVH